jgi:hypothetical protein
MHTGRPGSYANSVNVVHFLHKQALALALEPQTRFPATQAVNLPWQGYLYTAQVDTADSLGTKQARMTKATQNGEHFSLKQ